MRDTRCWTQSTVQSMPRVLGTSASSTARAITSYELIQQKTRSTSSPFSISSLSRTFTSGRADHTVTGTGRKKVLENTTLQIKLQQKCRKKRFLNIHDRFIRDTWFRKTMPGSGSHWRSDSRDGQTGERRPHPKCHRRRRTQRVSWQLVGHVRILWVPTRYL